MKTTEIQVGKIYAYRRGIYGPVEPAILLSSERFTEYGRQEDKGKCRAMLIRGRSYMTQGDEDDRASVTQALQWDASDYIAWRKKNPKHGSFYARETIPEGLETPEGWSVQFELPRWLIEEWAPFLAGAIAEQKAREATAAVVAEHEAAREAQAEKITADLIARGLEAGDFVVQKGQYKSTNSIVLNVAGYEKLVGGQF